eukprot:SAG22_NODE_11156_length_498_cov_0.576441_1_plen_111_part_01
MTGLGAQPKASLASPIERQGVRTPLDQMRSETVADPQACRSAAAAGQLEMLREIHANDPDDRFFPYEDAARNNHFHTLRWMHVLSTGSPRDLGAPRCSGSPRNTLAHPVWE